MRVDSPANPRIKSICGLAARRKARIEAGAFVAEGQAALAIALAHDWTVHTLVLGPAAREEEETQTLAARARARGADILEVPLGILRSIARRDNTQSLIGIYATRILRLPSTPSAEQLWLALDRIRDPGNLGTILRTAAAAEASGVVLIGDCVDPFSLEAVRASAGAVFAMPIARLDRAAYLAWRTSWQGRIVATRMRNATDFRDCDLTLPLVLLMGNESTGLDAQLAATADAFARIPQSSSVESLNLAVASALMLYEARRPA